MAFGFLSGLAAPGDTFLGTPPGTFQELPSFSTGTFVVFGLHAILLTLFLPLGLLFVIGIQSVNPFSDDVWTRPTHHSNPLHLGNPLLFFHFFAFFVGASGLGVVVSSLWNGLPAALHGILGLWGSSMILVGIRLCMRVFQHKLNVETPRNEA